MHRSSRVFLCAATGSALFAGPAHAQQAIEEIVVTAERREQTIQSVPGAITAVTTAQLKLQGIDSATSLQFGVPGVFVGVMAARSGGISPAKFLVNVARG